MWSEISSIRAVRGHWLAYAYVIEAPDKSVNSLAATEDAAIARCLSHMRSYAWHGPVRRVSR